MLLVFLFFACKFHSGSVSYTANEFYHYRPQTKFAKVMFLHVSVILSTGGLCLGPGPGGRLGSLARWVSRPIPGGEVGGSDWGEGVSRSRPRGVSWPIPGGRLEGGGVQVQAQAQAHGESARGGCPGPHLGRGRVQAHIKRGVSRPRPGGCPGPGSRGVHPSMH